MTAAGHIHHIIRSPRGEDICTSCGEIVITPILSSNDERLNGAGGMRSHQPFYQDPSMEELPPLPIVLITLYYDGPEYGYPKAPIAPYIETVAVRESLTNKNIDDDFWDKLSKRHN